MTLFCQFTFNADNLSHTYNLLSSVTTVSRELRLSPRSQDHKLKQFSSIIVDNSLRTRLPFGDSDLQLSLKGQK